MSFVRPSERLTRSIKPDKLNSRSKNCNLFFKKKDQRTSASAILKDSFKSLGKHELVASFLPLGVTPPLLARCVGDLLKTLILFFKVRIDPTTGSMVLWQLLLGSAASSHRPVGVAAL